MLIAGFEDTFRTILLNKVRELQELAGSRGVLDENSGKIVEARHRFLQNLDILQLFKEVAALTADDARGMLTGRLIRLRNLENGLLRH